jgi:hypothetical protein
VGEDTPPVDFAKKFNKEGEKTPQILRSAIFGTVLRK